MKVSLKTMTPNAEVNIVEIARVSSSRTDKAEAPEGLINYLIKNKHWSPFQHSYITFEIETSKAIGIQLLRHLSFTFQEFSQRYSVVEEIEDIEFRLQATKNRQSSTMVVGGIQQMPEDLSVWHINLDDYLELDKEQVVPIDAIQDWIERAALHLKECLSLYKEGIELGIAKECARMILPLASKTTIFMTGSIRSWIHFLEIRLDGHAQKEARLIAEEIRELVKVNLPIISKARGYIE